MTNIRTTGLILFLAGFGLFLVSFFLNQYSITNNIINDQIPEGQQRNLFFKEVRSLTGKTIGNSFDFIRKLDVAFSTVNNQQISTYSFNENDYEKIIKISSENGLEFHIELIDSLFPGSDQVSEFKKNAFKSYGSWLDGRVYEDKESLQRDIKGVAKNIASYEIINKKGFDRYRVKSLKYSLTRSSAIGLIVSHSLMIMLLVYGMCIIGALLYILPGVKELPGIKNNGIFSSAMSNRGWLGIMTGTFLIIFYIFLYYFPEYMTSWIIMVDPVSMVLSGSEAGRFFLYGLLYSLVILVMGIRMLIKYKGNRYQQFRTGSVMFFQTAFAFLIPEILIRLNKPYFDFKNIWPLDYDFFFESELSKLIDGGTLGIFMLGWGIALIVIAVPVLVYFYGKRWYCSWVCGCGGLAETLGDPYRQLSDKSVKAWKIERWMINSVLVLAVLMTAGVLYTYWTGNSQILGLNSYTVREAYGFWIGAAFAGVVGTGFYPLMGNRVWCRFGCPLAAYLGFIQRFKSRFRITTSGGQCISCGNCSTYCEMGIDVRWYAQRGQNIVRSSCVGCGICSAVCPRGVLKLETASEKGRISGSGLTGNKSFDE